MPSDRAYINRGIWNDADHRQLSPEAQHLYYMLLTHPTLSYVGIVDWRPNRFVPFARGLTVERIETAAVELSAGLYIVIDEGTEEVLIRSWVKHDGVLKQPRLAVSMANAYTRIASNAIRGVVVHELTKQREAHPEYGCWEDSRVADVLSQPSVSATDLPPFTPGVGDAFGGPLGGAFTPNATPGLGSGLVCAPSPSPSPPSSTKKEGSPSPSKSTPSKDFEEWWSHWRKKKSIGDARKALPKALKKISLAELIERTDAYWAWADATGEDEQFIPYPATWLNREQWADELTIPEQQATIPTQWKDAFNG